MNITDISVKRPVGTIMFFIGVILLGWISSENLSINLLPDISYPKITVLTEYPGSGPEEIERFITRDLESALAPVKGVKKVTSSSKEGVSIITLEFHWGTDMDFALLHTKEKVEEMRRNLPQDCPAPVILEWDPASSPIILAVVKSRTRNSKNLKETAEFIIKPRLEQVEGIARVEIRGGDEEEISVEIDPEKLKAINLTLDSVVSVIEENNKFQSGGTVKKDKLKYTLKIEGEIKSPAEIEQLVVKNLYGRRVRIGDIGSAFYKNKLRQGDIRLDHMESLALLVYRESSGNTVDSTNAAEKSLKSLKDEFKDLDFFIISKEAEMIISSIDSLIMSLVFGGGLAFFVLLLFLQNFRDPLFGAVTILISIVSTFTLMFFLKVNINIMSLGGLVLGVGMFVDNAIIVIESIFRHRDKEALIPSVINGAKEVSGAISASTLTTISIFLPVIYLYGISGKLFRDQALTVSFSLVSSLIVAITLLPSLSAFRSIFSFKSFKDEQEEKRELKWYMKPFYGLNFLITAMLRFIGIVFNFLILGALKLVFVVIPLKCSELFLKIMQPLFRFFNSSYEKFDAFYHKILDKVLQKKIIALWLTIAVIAVIIPAYILLKKELIPVPDSSKFEININTKPLFGFEETNNIAKRIEEKITENKNVDFVYTEAGAVSKFAARNEDFSVNAIHFLVSCVSNEKRAETMSEIRELFLTEDFKDDILKYSFFLEKNSLSQYLTSGEDKFQIKLFYEDINTGKEGVARILSKISSIKGLIDLKATISEGKALFSIKFREDMLAQLNLTKGQISGFINKAVRGTKAGELKRVQKNLDIFVRVPVTGVMDIDRLLYMPVTVNKESYFIKDLIEVKRIPSIKEIRRESQERFFLISGDVKDAELDHIIKEAELKLEGIDLPDNTRYVFSGEEEERRKAFDSLNQAIWLAVILVYMVMAAKFENIFQPLIIMFTVPMGIVGAFLFLLIFNFSLNIISGIGIMVLIGIGVNDAIVKVEYSNQMRKEGKSIREAVLLASKVRLRPILMTTFTTVSGLIPMAVMSQTGSELQQPLALVIIGGLMFTTFLTLILIPVAYEILETIIEKRKRGKKAVKEAVSE